MTPYRSVQHLKKQLHAVFGVESFVVNVEGPLLSVLHCFCTLKVPGLIDFQEEDTNALQLTDLDCVGNNTSTGVRLCSNKMV